MASNTRGPRGGSRKPRPRAGAHGDADVRPSGSKPVSRQAAARAARATAMPVHRTYGERPEPPWHPVPLSELLILAGAVAFVIAMTRLGHGISAGGPLLLAGIAAVALGTIEVSWREHSSGFRSHTTLLSFMPVVLLHSVVVLGASLFVKVPELLNLGMIAVDVAVFVLLFKLMRARFLDARARAAAGL